MEILNFIFRLGVVFAIFGFIWTLINLGIKLLTLGRERQTTEIYILKGFQYLLLVNVTFLICYNNIIKSLDQHRQLVFGAIVLLMYFIGRLQRNQNRQSIMKIYTNGLLKNINHFNYKAEIFVILLALGTFITFWFYPDYAFNPVSIWFQDTIIDIEDTPIFGFIFKVVGFFFLLSILLKIINAILMIILGKAIRRNEDSDNNENKFDDFEEIK